jgi:hypothetical protein
VARVRHHGIKVAHWTHMEIEYWNVDVIQKFRVVLDRITAREEYDILILHVLLKESE